MIERGWVSVLPQPPAKAALKPHEEVYATIDTKFPSSITMEVHGETVTEVSALHNSGPAAVILKWDTAEITIRLERKSMTELAPTINLETRTEELRTNIPPAQVTFTKNGVPIRSRPDMKPLQTQFNPHELPLVWRNHLLEFLDY